MALDKALLVTLINRLIGIQSVIDSKEGKVSESRSKKMAEILGDNPDPAKMYPDIWGAFDFLGETPTVEFVRVSFMLKRIQEWVTGEADKYINSLLVSDLKTDDTTAQKAEAKTLKEQIKALKAALAYDKSIDLSDLPEIPGGKQGRPVGSGKYQNVERQFDRYSVNGSDVSETKLSNLVETVSGGEYQTRPFIEFLKGIGKEEFDPTGWEVTFKNGNTLTYRRVTEASTEE